MRGLTTQEAWRAASALRDNADANESSARRMASLGNMVAAEEFLVEVNLDRKLAHKIDDDFWGDNEPPAATLEPA